MQTAWKAAAAIPCDRSCKALGGCATTYRDSIHLPPHGSSGKDIVAAVSLAPERADVHEAPAGARRCKSGHRRDASRCLKEGKLLGCSNAKVKGWRTDCRALVPDSVGTLGRSTGTSACSMAVSQRWVTLRVCPSDKLTSRTGIAIFKQHFLIGVRKQSSDRKTRGREAVQLIRPGELVRIQFDLRQSNKRGGCKVLVFFARGNAAGPLPGVSCLWQRHEAERANGGQACAACSLRLKSHVSFAHRPCFVAKPCSSW